MVRVFDEYHGWRHKCKNVCPENQYVYRARCYTTCPISTFPQENGFIKYCVNNGEFSCPESICRKESPFCFNDLCLATCPEYTVSYKKSCVLRCPPEGKYVTAYSCTGVCYSGNNKTCTQACPESHPFVFRSTYLNHCLDKCPLFTAVNGTRCNLNCPIERPYLYKGKCVSACPPERPFVSLWNTLFNKIPVCTDRCHEGMGSFQNVCVPVCPSDSPYEYRGECVRQCSEDRPYVKSTPSKRATIYYQQCVKTCPKSEKTWEKAKQCVFECPKTTLLFNKNCVSECPSSFPFNYTKENSEIKHECVKICPPHTYQYNYNCFDSCPANLKYYLSNCTKECPKVSPYISSNNTTCVKSCGKHEVYSGNACAKICPEEHKYIDNKRCVKFCADTHDLQQKIKQGILCLKPPCPTNTSHLEGTNQCVERCPQNMLIINGICKNSTSCPDGKYKENSTIGVVCVGKCSSAFYVDGNRCVKKCSSKQVIAGRNCSVNCSSAKPYRFINVSDYENPMTVCVLYCPEGFLIFRNKCIEYDDCINKLRVVYQDGCYDSCPPPTVLDSRTNCSYDTVELYTTLEAVSFSLAFILFLFILFMCCYKGRLGCKCKPSSAKELVSFQLES